MEPPGTVRVSLVPFVQPILREVDQLKVSDLLNPSSRSDALPVVNAADLRPSTLATAAVGPGALPPFEEEYLPRDADASVNLGPRQPKGTKQGGLDSLLQEDYSDI